VKVRALGVRHGLKVLLHMGSPRLRIEKSAIGIPAVAVGWLSHRVVRATYAVYSTVSSSSTLMTVPTHGSTGLRGIVTLTSHLSRPWAIDMRPQ
jgi:hypothetical protein